MNQADPSTILQLLQSKQLITPEQAAQLAQQFATVGGDPFQVIEDQHAIGPEDLAQVKSEAYQMPYAQLLNQEIPKEVLHTIGADIAENYHVVPFDKKEGVISVAIQNPFDYKAIEALDFISRRDSVQFAYHIASEESIRSVLRQYGNLSEQVNEALESGGESSVLIEENPDDDDVQSSAQSAPVSKMVSVIMRYAVEGSASDVHIEPDNDGTRVRYRVDGELNTSLQVPKKLHNALVARIKVLANLKLDETRLPQDGRFRMKIDGRPVDFRVSTMPLIGQEKVVLRILDKEDGKNTLENLGYSDHNLEMLQQVITRPHGMVLVTGPTGSGKSTTLNAVLESLNNENVNIITLEDPVEYDIPGISQTQVRPEIGLTFARGLRAILRQDPDIIMAGEVRDKETAELAVHAALTGHMLLSTLHTNDAFGALPRLVDMEIEPFLIASALEAVVAQRLVRRICSDCVEPLTLPVKMESAVLAELQNMPEHSRPADVSMDLPMKVFKGKGCSRCDDTGYRGRLPISEIIVITPRLEELIGQGQISMNSEVEQELVAQGMISMKQDGIIKAMRGLTTIEEVWTATQE